MKKATIISSVTHSDLRGSHKKFFGVTPESILVNDFEIKEVFMTTNNKNVIRGFHFQEGLPQAKIIQVITGSILVNAVNLDTSSDDIGEIITVRLDSNDDKRFYVPGNWALGYLALEDNTKVLYLADNYFNADADTGIDPFDPVLNADWNNIKKNEALLSPRDQNLESYTEWLQRKKEEK